MVNFTFFLVYFWPRFYIMVLGIVFFFIMFIYFPYFIRIFISSFLFGPIFPFLSLFLLGVLFQFAIWAFFSITFQFFYSLWITSKNLFLWMFKLFKRNITFIMYHSLTFKFLTIFVCVIKRISLLNNIKYYKNRKWKIEKRFLHALRCGNV